MIRFMVLARKRNIEADILISCRIWLMARPTRISKSIRLDCSYSGVLQILLGEMWGTSQNHKQQLPSYTNLNNHTIKHLQSKTHTHLKTKDSYRVLTSHTYGHEHGITKQNIVEQNIKNLKNSSYLTKI